MRLIGPDLILATGDLTKFVRCEHATFLDHSTKTGAVTPLARRPPSAMTDLIVEKGEEHENAFVEQLRATGATIVTIERKPWSIGALRRAETETLQAMRAGADYIYQAAFFDGRWSGYADLLQRIHHPSPSLGAWSYEVVDTKLARAVQAHFLLQLSDYSSHVTRLQGSAPESMHVVLGTGERHSFHVSDFAAYYRHVRASLDRFLVRGDSTTPYPVTFCTLCEWEAHCWKHWNDVDHLSLVANIRRTQATRLERAGVETLTALAEAQPQLRIRKVAEESFATLNHQARLQLQHRRSGTHMYELLPREPGRGFFRLPQPSNRDVFFDVEGDPFVGDGLTYLFGAAWEEDGVAKYQSWWAHDSNEERVAFESVMDFLAGRHDSDQNAHIYHYGAMEVSTLKRLMGRHGTRENALDDLLRHEAFVDLSGVVRQGMRISHSSYGLKKVETFYGFDRKAKGVAHAGGAVLAYEQWLASNDDAMLDEIEGYNREDCLSIVAMRRWLIDIRPDDVQWKVPQDAQELSESRIEEDQRNDELYQRLMTDGSALLAHLLYYHRREERPAWWSWFERRNKMTDEELIDDNESIGQLARDESIAPVKDKKSFVFTYTFPSQEHKFDAGDTAYARTERAGEIVRIDDAHGIVELKRGPKLLQVAHPDALIPKPSIDSGPIRDALQKFAHAVVETGLTSNRYRAATDILLASTPRFRNAPMHANENVLDATRRLYGSYLFVQGPPGSGKTFHGARAIVALLREGMRVGVTSNSHKAIHNLLHEIEAVARGENYWFRGLKKSGADEDSAFVSKLPNPMIEATSKADDCADGSILLVAGTAWLFSDPDMDQSLDYLFIDEAGQVSLANAIAVATAARNVVLLGDPLQLAQVSQGSHPDGVSVSVLEHLLGSHNTVPPDRGIFLEESWRMHPDVCAFVSEIVYESRLRWATECTNQAVTLDGVVETGVRFMAVEHEGNGQSSDEEAERVAIEIRRMLRGTFTNSRGQTAPLRPEDFLVVAAYNAQVRHLTQALTAAGLQDVPVGTVDKFQGRQAPIVFFSMATSSGAELPRDVEFLFSRNRLNVAISRARCLAVVVASPRLLDVHCTTPEQMRLVNGMCRFVEMARAI
ncbi:MAG: TM0106 family RecB-like putative nuclease [Thermoanaerobaculia bacterium]